MSHVDGRTEYVDVEDMGEAADMKLVDKVLKESLGKRKLWFSMKFDRRILALVGRYGDLLKLVKGNDEYAFLYMSGKDRPSHVAWECTVKQSHYLL